MKERKEPIPPDLTDVMNERISVLDFIKAFSKGITVLDDYKAELESQYFKMKGKLPPAERDDLATILGLSNAVITELGSVLNLKNDQMNSLVEFSLGLTMELRKIHAQKKTQ